MKKLLFIVIVAILGLTACGPSPEELVQQGKAYLENDECIEAVKCFEKAVKKGNVEAMHEIGWMYLDGKCVDKDYEEAATWFKHAADRGYPDAQGQLALMYYYGDGVPQDYEKAAKWAKKAVVYDVDDAQYVLASLYIIGKGVPQDFNKAAELLLNLEKKGGDSAKEAQGGLAIMYLKGLGVPQSDDKAVEMWCKANDLSIAEAQFEIGDWYGKGNTELNIKQDVDKAVKWFRRAAENGNATAQYYVGNAYRKGISVTKSLTKAKYWFQKAADQGNEKAKENLKVLEKAEKVKRDIEVAEKKALQEKEAAEKKEKAKIGVFDKKTFTVDGVSFEMVGVQGGTFTMGGTSEQGRDVESDEKPTHNVTLSDFYIGEFEVTQALWVAIMGNNPAGFQGDNLPVVWVGWDVVQEFIRKLNQKTGARFRLPTEAEWEYAARGGNISKGYKYSGSNNIGDVAWYDGNSGGKIHQVGTKAPNELGVYDMTGNVSEWCQDWYGDYSGSIQLNPIGAYSGSYRVYRGGCCTNFARYCRVSDRDYGKPSYGDSHRGFRLVLVP